MRVKTGLSVIAVLAGLKAAAARADDSTLSDGAASDVALSELAGAELAARAQAVLEAHCARCHGGARHGAEADQGGFDHVLDPARMSRDGQIAPRKAEASPLYRRMRDGEMPPEPVTSRPSDIDIDIVRQWIARGAPAFAHQVERRRSSRRASSSADFTATCAISRATVVRICAT